MIQIDMFSFLDEINRPAPHFKKGDVIYKLYLDVIIKGIVESTYVCGSGNGYCIKEEGRGYNCFWDRSINDTVFSDLSKAEHEADKRKQLYKVIRSSDMKVLEEKSFIKIINDNRNFLSVTVKLLEGNMVYFEDWHCYPFLEIFKTEAEAKKKFNKILKEKYQSIDNYKCFEANIHLNTKDMYKALNGNWSSWGYVEHNGPVTISHALSHSA